MKSSARPLILAHRGACRVRYENTLEAIQVAEAMGADGVELDVRMTSDEQLVLCHDATLLGSLLSESTLDELRRLDLDGSRIATVEEALDVAKNLFVNLELKRPGGGRLEVFGEKLAQLTLEFSGQLLVTSFFTEILEVVVPKLASKPSIGVLTGVAYDQDGLLSIKEAKSRQYQFALPQNPSVGEAAIQKAHAEGLQIITWTVDDPERIKMLASTGIDAVITNEPDVAIKAISELS